MSRTPNARIPEIIGGLYRVTERIGGGSFGEIYKAIDTISGQEVAVKLVGIPYKPRNSQ